MEVRWRFPGVWEVKNQFCLYFPSKTSKMVIFDDFWRFLTILDDFEEKIKAKLVFDPPNPRKTSTHVPRYPCVVFHDYIWLFPALTSKNMSKSWFLTSKGIFWVPQGIPRGPDPQEHPRTTKTFTNHPLSVLGVRGTSPAPTVSK